MELILAIEGKEETLVRRDLNNKEINVVKRVIISNDHILRTFAYLGDNHKRILKSRLNNCSLQNKRRDVVKKFCKEFFD